MEMVIKKWGNSLATRIPKAIADKIGLYLDQSVNIEAENGKIVITPKPIQIEYTLDELISQCDSKSIKPDDEDRKWLNDEPVGREWKW